jgi:hypothetical protein
MAILPFAGRQSWDAIGETAFDVGSCRTDLIHAGPVTHAHLPDEVFDSPGMTTPTLIHRVSEVSGAVRLRSIAVLA